MRTIEYPITFVGVGAIDPHNPQEAGNTAEKNLNTKMLEFFETNPDLQVKGAPKLFHSSAEGYFFVSNTIVVKKEIE